MVAFIFVLFCLRGEGGKFILELEYDILIRKYILYTNSGYSVLGLALLSRLSVISLRSEGRSWKSGLHVMSWISAPIKQ